MCNGALLCDSVDVSLAAAVSFAWYMTGKCLGGGAQCFPPVWGRRGNGSKGYEEKERLKIAEGKDALQCHLHLSFTIPLTFLPF